MSDLPPPEPGRSFPAPEPERRRRAPRGRPARTPAVVAASVLVVLAVALAWWWSGRDDAGSEPPSATLEATVAPAPDSSGSPPDESAATVDTTIPPTGASTVPTTVPPTTAVAGGGRIDVGAGIGFTAPNGFTTAVVAPGVEITDGTVRLYAAASTRTAGEDPLVVLQEYVTGFDALYVSAAYTQVSGRPADPAGVAPVDGRSARYRVMAADGTGYAGRLDVLRRADGLVLLIDRYVAIDANAGSLAVADAVLVPAAVAELAASLQSAPAVATPVTPAPLVPARLTTVHPQLGVEAGFALMPPAGWVDVGSTPGRVVVAHPAGETFVVERTADAADAAVAELQALGALLTQWPTASAGAFGVVDPGDGRTVRTSETTFTATAPDGRPVNGTVRVWWDAATGRSWVAVGTALADVDPQPGHAAFLLAQCDAELAGLPG